ncbi:MAG TPA: hypothetical protein PKW99_00840 [Thauera sp.]|jgi:mono/diheme cytochrome c family protein|nr:hypothetical protein [Thauera sp.]
MKTTPLHRHGLVKLFATALFVATALPVAADPFPNADLAAGERMHAEQCVACHAKRFGGEDGTAIYTRPDHRVTTLGELAQQLSRCTSMLKLDLFPEDEENIAAYLNKHYYKFQ